MSRVQYQNKTIKYFVFCVGLYLQLKGRVQFALWIQNSSSHNERLESKILVQLLFLDEELYSESLIRSSEGGDCMALKFNEDNLINFVMKF